MCSVFFVRYCDCVTMRRQQPHRDRLTPLNRQLSVVSNKNELNAADSTEAPLLFFRGSCCMYFGCRYFQSKIIWCSLHCMCVAQLHRRRGSRSCFCLEQDVADYLRCRKKILGPFFMCLSLSLLGTKNEEGDRHTKSTQRTKKVRSGLSQHSILSC